jgi:TonB family protein
MAEKKQRRKMVITLVILSVILAAILVSERTVWFGTDETSNDEALSGPAPNSTAQAAPAHNPAPISKSVPSSGAQAPSAHIPGLTAKTKNEAAAKGSAEPAAAGASVIATNRTQLPPIEFEVVAGDTHRNAQPGNNSVKVEIPPSSGFRAAGSTAFQWNPATNAAERTLISSNLPEPPAQSVELSYPSLARQMKVQGSVLLQVFVDTDGGIRDLRVLSGDPILVSAALEAARQWRFKPYLQNGQPVETQAKIMVNFTMKVL